MEKPFEVREPSFTLVPGDLRSASHREDLTAVFEQTPNPISILDPWWNDGIGDWDFLYFRTNRAFREIFWEGSDRNNGQAFSELCRHSLYESLLILRGVSLTGISQEGEVFFAEQRRWFNVSIYRAETGRLVLIHNEITEKETLRQRADQEQARYHRLFEMGAVKLVVSSETLVVREANGRAVDFYGWSLEELRTKRLDDFSSLSGDTLTRVLGRSGGTEAILLAEQRRSDGRVLAVEVHVTQLLVREERVFLLIVFDRIQSSRLRLQSEALLGQAVRVSGAESDKTLLFAAFRQRYGGEFPFLDELIPPLLGIGRARHFHRGEFFIAAGEYAGGSAFSPQGVFRSYLIDRKGKEVTLGFHRPGEFVASYSALVTGEVSQIFLEALNDCDAFVMDAREFHNCMIADPRWFMVCYRLLQQEIFLREQREISLLSRSLKERYRDFTQSNQDIIGLLHNYQIASYLGVTPETLSRIRRAD